MKMWFNIISLDFMYTVYCQSCRELGFIPKGYIEFMKIGLTKLEEKN